MLSRSKETHLEAAAATRRMEKCILKNECGENVENEVV